MASDKNILDEYKLIIAKRSELSKEEQQRIIGIIEEEQ